MEVEWGRVSYKFQVKRNVKYHGQHLEQLFIVVTAFTVRAASHVDDLTWHSVFHRQIHGSNKRNSENLSTLKRSSTKVLEQILIFENL